MADNASEQRYQEEAALDYVMSLTQKVDELVRTSSEESAEEKRPEIESIESNLKKLGISDSQTHEPIK